VTFDETTPYHRGVFECAGDKEIEERIFVDEGLQCIDGDKDLPLLPSTSLPKHVPASTFVAEAPQATSSSTAAPLHIQKTHSPQQIIGNLKERVTRSSRSAHLFCFSNMLFVALFEP
jgi:hypothetical protein